MAKNSLGNPNVRQSHIDPPRNPSGHGRGNGRDWVDHGGRRISSGPGPGGGGVSRSDGPAGRAYGDRRDLKGNPRAPSR